MYLGEANENKRSLWRHIRMCGSSREKEIVVDSQKRMASTKEKAAIRRFVCELLREEPDLRQAAFIN